MERIGEVRRGVCGCWEGWTVVLEGMCGREAVGDLGVGGEAAQGYSNPGAGGRPPPCGGGGHHLGGRCVGVWEVRG